MKKTINILLSILLASICLIPISVFADENSGTELDLAFDAIESYLEVRSWDNFEPTNPEVIYDADLVEYGYVFELHDGSKEGYGIVVKHGNEYIFAEGSIETPSPYKTVPASHKNVYPTALGYYSYNPLSRSANSFLRLDTNEYLSQDDFENVRVEADVFISSSMSRSAVTSVKYLNSYGTKFVGIAQTNNSACIPTSSIMALKYLSNTARLTLYGSNLEQLATNLHYAMDSSLGRVTDNEAKNGIDSWTSNTANCSRRITFGSTYTYTPTVAAWAPVKAEIDGNYPVICMFKENVVGYSVTHATTMVGYQIVQLDTYDNAETYYTIVKDPGRSSVPEKTVLWSVSNIYGYFILYLH